MKPESNSAADESPNVSLTRFVGYFLRLGTVGFGGPIALAGHMQQDLVSTNIGDKICDQQIAKDRSPKWPF